MKAYSCTCWKPLAYSFSRRAAPSELQLTVPAPRVRGHRFPDGDFCAISLDICSRSPVLWCDGNRLQTSSICVHQVPRRGGSDDDNRLREKINAAIVNES
eukprot:6201540-Pleurochrysis_carterae.AAC.1